METEEPYAFHMAYFYATNPIAPTVYAEPERWYNALMEDGLQRRPRTAS